MHRMLCILSLVQQYQLDTFPQTPWYLYPERVLVGKSREARGIHRSREFNHETFPLSPTISIPFHHNNTDTDNGEHSTPHPHSHTQSQSTYILAASRTPIGSKDGSLASLTAPQLGIVAVKHAIERAGINADRVEEIYMGNVVQAGVGQNPARQVGIGAG
jgi:hypothetical protein